MTIHVDKALYCREVLLKTAYTFTSQVYLHLSQSDSEWIISWTPKANSDVDPAEFENELISQQLRFLLLEKTSDIRKLILARAFASTVIDNSAVRIDSNEFTDANNADILKDWYENDDSI